MKATNDGPYIFYRGNTILVRSIVTKKDKPLAQTQSYHLQQKKDLVVTCTFTDHPEWDFSTHLKDTLSIAPCVYPAADKILAISDIEGNFDVLRDLLLANGVIDTGYNWTFGAGHLVLAGDCFDRGAYVTECLWLLYSLEEKATQQGGYLHFILGNHEIMNMSDDLRYVHEKYLANARLLRQDYQLWYKPATELGHWLATKNIMEKIGPLLFVHGGVAEPVNALHYSLPAINQLCRPWYFTPVQALPIAQAALYDLLYSSDSPFWYRGYALGDATEQQVNRTLLKFDVQHIVTGHTTMEQVTTFFNGKVIDIDTPHAAGISEGVLIEKGRIYRVDKQGRREMIS